MGNPIVKYNGSNVLFIIYIPVQAHVFIPSIVLHCTHAGDGQNAVVVKRPA